MRSGQPATQIIRHRSEHGRWQAAIREPDPRLRADVRQYLGYVEHTTRFEQRRELPTGDAELIIGFGTPVRVVDPRRPAETAEYGRAFVTGPDDAYALTDTGGAWHGVQVSLRPIGARRLFGLPMSELARRVVELEDLFGAGAARRLTERLAEAPDWESRFRILDAFLLARLATASAPITGVAWAWRQLHDSGGGLRVADLTAELGCSRKILAARFRDQIGLTPKVLARVFRFNRVLEILDRDATVSWADVAYACGYYDQAHLIRDCRQFAGATPGELFRRRLPDRGGVVGDMSNA